jgi:hypothetical protein
MGSVVPKTKLQNLYCRQWDRLDIGYARAARVEVKAIGYFLDR